MEYIHVGAFWEKYTHVEIRVLCLENISLRLYDIYRIIYYNYGTVMYSEITARFLSNITKKQTGNTTKITFNTF